jgi:hypothetical protein
MDDRSILERVNQLVEEERRLREAAPGGEASAQLAGIERELDQCWDLLRQRRAQREFGNDPDRAQPRSEDSVERYAG